MQENKSVCNKEYWEKGWSESGTAFFSLGRQVLLDFIDRHIPDTSEGTCLEIGCVPGSYLGHLARKGYEISGVDWADQVRFMARAARAEGFKSGSFFQSDIMEFYPAATYDVVCSFGFIEHFTNWRQILIRHCACVKEGGYLIVTFPNLRGAFLHTLFRHLAPAWLDSHHIPAMDAPAQADVAQKAGFDIVFEGYFGGFDFLPSTFGTDDPEKRRLHAATLILAREGLEKGMLFPDDEAWSPFGGFVARKNT